MELKSCPECGQKFAVKFITHPDLRAEEILSKITPGVWDFMKDGRIISEVLTTEDSVRTIEIAVISTKDTSKKEAEANGKLIIMAPDMYEAIKSNCSNCGYVRCSGCVFSGLAEEMGL